ncbi:XrtA-associated tyrosine autokinase [Aestuariirhabdus sp. Z084]|uniref:XrtA-associated tyrosine autokinase n=1 Tax=Aestuariirhabdus haliotis TaxID=2918751 RepID=UPI00201B3806|nr:XrtA-associated tyrosine autokinase [Aestuariirhabdus haliotis]MCL6414675.1 XrtA-associated tyrosine autokinase [Aestuariirhabdus haliotis]MCL6418607.1 XrtA-associated tyrosine autokinase [Aestuariirhabdus haliotis]
MDTIEKALSKKSVDGVKSDVDSPQKAISNSDIVESAVTRSRKETVSAERKPSSSANLTAKVGTEKIHIKDSSISPGKKIDSSERSSATKPSVNLGAPIVIDFELLRSKNFIVPDEERSLVKEQFRHIKRSILGKAFNGSQSTNSGFGNLVMITSASPQEGKTFTAINLALSIAMEQDRKILLVDADVVQPSLNSSLNIPRSEGIVDYLNSDDIAFESILHKTNIDNLSLVLAGNKHHLTNELLASQSMKDLMEELTNRYPDRLVMLDTPPLCHTTEASILASLAGQVIVVVEEGRTTQRRLKDALNLVSEHQDVSLLMNKCSSAREGSYYGYY